MSRRGLGERRRSLLLIGSAALVLALGTVLLVHQLDRHSRSAEVSLRDPLRIEIERDGFAPVVLARPDRDSPWRIEAPCPLPVVAARLTPLLQALNGASARYPASEVDLEGAGLAEPMATLVLDGERLAIGGPDLGGERRYLRQGDTVELVPEWILSLVQGGMTALAEPALFEHPVSSVMEADGSALTIPVEDWSALESTQIVDWPLAEAVPITDRRSLTVRFDDDSERGYELVRTERFDALVADSGGCARLLVPHSLPSLAASSG